MSLEEVQYQIKSQIYILHKPFTKYTFLFISLKGSRRLKAINMSNKQQLFSLIKMSLLHKIFADPLQQNSTWPCMVFDCCHWKLLFRKWPHVEMSRTWSYWRSAILGIYSYISSSLSLCLFMSYSLDIFFYFCFYYPTYSSNALTHSLITVCINPIYT